MRILKCLLGSLAAVTLGFGIFRLETERPRAELERAGVSIVADEQGVVQSVAFQKADASDRNLYFAAQLKSVTSVYLCDRHVTRQGLQELSKLPGLKRLDLTNSHATAGSLAAVGQIRSLQFLNLAHCTWVTDDEIAQLKPAPELQSLQLEDCPITDAGLALLGRLSSLRSLGLGDCHAVRGAGLECLSALPQLEEVTLDGLYFTGEGLECLHAFPALRTVSLRGIRLPQRELEQLLSGPRPLSVDLSSVELSELSPLYDLGATVRVNPRLEAAVVYLGDAGSRQSVSLNDDALAALLQFPTIEVLSLSRVPVTDAGLQFIGKLQRVHEIRLQDLPITDRGLEDLASLPALKYLGVYRCPLTGEGFHAFHRSQLQALAILSSTGLTPEGLGQIGRIPNLHGLQIHGALPQAGWEELTTLSPLNRLSLVDCALTTQVIEALACSSSIATVRLQDSVLSDEVLTACTTLPRQCRLEISNCRFSREILEQVSEARPDMAVVENSSRSTWTLMPR